MCSSNLQGVLLHFYAPAKLDGQSHTYALNVSSCPAV